MVFDRRSLLVPVDLFYGQLSALVAHAGSRSDSGDCGLVVFGQLESGLVRPRGSRGDFLYDRKSDEPRAVQPISRDLYILDNYFLRKLERRSAQRIGSGVDSDVECGGNDIDPGDRALRDGEH